MFLGWRSRVSSTPARIKESLPVQRGNVSLSNLQVLNAILYVAEQGCKWGGLPKRFGNWHTVYMRMNRWAKNGVLDRVFGQLQLQQIVRIRIEAFSLDSTSVKVHPDGTGALKKTSCALKPSFQPVWFAFEIDERIAGYRFSPVRLTGFQCDVEVLALCNGT
jgi:transposase